MSASVSTATPARPTSPSASGWSESRPINVGMSNAVERPLPPAASSWRKRSIGVLGGAEAGELAHRPELRPVHRGVRARGCTATPRDTRRRPVRTRRRARCRTSSSATRIVRVQQRTVAPTLRVPNPSRRTSCWLPSEHRPGARCEAGGRCRGSPRPRSANDPRRAGRAPVASPSHTVSSPATDTARNPAGGRVRRYPPSGRSCGASKSRVSISSSANTARSPRLPARSRRGREARRSRRSVASCSGRPARAGGGLVAGPVREHVEVRAGAAEHVEVRAGVGAADQRVRVRRTRASTSRAAVVEVIGTAVLISFM